MLSILNSRSTKDFLNNLIVFILYILILTLIMNLLWNKIMVRYITVIKPIDVWWHTLLLAIGIASFRA
jgi:steroid 5-alpha reductase family enzyme